MRRRELRPEFFLDDKLGMLPPLARLFYQGLWCVSDREGRLVYEPRILWAKVLPYDVWDESVVLALEERRRVLPYGLNGTRYAWLPNLERHQHFHPNEQPSVLPKHPDDATEDYQRITKDIPKDHQRSTLVLLKESSGIPQGILSKPLTSSPSLPSQPSSPSGEAQQIKNYPPPPADDHDTGLTDEQIKAKGLALHAELDRQATERKAKEPPIPYDDIVAAYHEKLPTLAGCRSHGHESPVRRNIKARWEACTERQNIAWWAEYFTDVAEMPWLMGEETGKDGRAPFKATLPWLVLPTNMDKVLNGFYQRKAKSAADDQPDESKRCPGCYQMPGNCYCEVKRDQERRRTAWDAAQKALAEAKGAPGAHD